MLKRTFNCSPPSESFMQDSSVPRDSVYIESTQLVCRWLVGQVGSLQAGIKTVIILAGYGRSALYVRLQIKMFLKQLFHPFGDH
jgi:hypothetical protein